MKRGKEERKFCMCIQRHKQIISAVILSFAVLLIIVIALFPSLVDRRTSSAVSAEQLDEGVQIALFDPRYQRDQHASAIDYQETTLKSTAKQGLLLRGPELTLPAGRYILEITGDCEQIDAHIKQLSIKISSSQNHDLLDQDVDAEALSNGEIIVPFTLEQDSTYVSWTISYSGDLRISLKAIRLRRDL